MSENFPPTVGFQLILDMKVKRASLTCLFKQGCHAMKGVESKAEAILFACANTVHPHLFENLARTGVLQHLLLLLQGVDVQWGLLDFIGRGIWCCVNGRAVLGLDPSAK